MEKLRLVAKEIRALTAMCSAPLRNVPDNVIAMNENDQTSECSLLMFLERADNFGPYMLVPYFVRILCTCAQTEMYEKSIGQ